MSTTLPTAPNLSTPLLSEAHNFSFGNSPFSPVHTAARSIPLSTHTGKGNVWQMVCKQLGHIAQTLIHRLKNVDGIDETAASLVLIRGVTGPVAAEAVFAVGLPFVLLGLVGMMDESAEARDALGDLLQNKKDLANQARQLAQLGNTPNLDKAREVRALKKQIKQKLADMPRAVRHEKTKEYVELFAKLHRLNGQQTEKLLLRCAAPFGTFALGAMAAGMLPGLAWGAAEIGVRALRQTTPETASELGGAPLAAQISAGAGAAVSMVFAPANAAMAGYASLRGLAGMAKNKSLNKTRMQAQQVSAENLSPWGKKLFDQYSKAEMRSNRLTHTRYGLATATGQSALAASGGLAIAGFFGATVATIGTGGMALPIGGAAMAIGAAGMRIRGEVAKDIRHGNPELPGIKNRHRIGQKIFIEETGETFFEDADQLSTHSIEQRLTYSHKDLAKDKLVSLAFSAIQEHSTLEGRQHAMQHWALELGGRKGKMIGRGTSLLPETIQEMRKLFYSDEVQRTLEAAFAQVSPGAAHEKLLTLVGYPNLPSVLNELNDTQLETICKKLVPDFEMELSQVQAQEKLLLLAIKAKGSARNPEQAMRNLKQRVYMTEKGLGTTLPQPARKELKALFDTLNSKQTFTEQSTLEKILQADDVQAMYAELQPAGLNAQNLFKKTMSKGNYSINMQTLVKFAAHSATLNNRLYELAAPVLIQQLKNDSKVRMNQAFELMGFSLLRDEQDKEFEKLG